MGGGEVGRPSSRPVLPPVADGAQVPQEGAYRRPRRPFSSLIGLTVPDCLLTRSTDRTRPVRAIPRVRRRPKPDGKALTRPSTPSSRHLGQPQAGSVQGDCPEGSPQSRRQGSPHKEGLRSVLARGHTSQGASAPGVHHARPLTHVCTVRSPPVAQASRRCSCTLRFVLVIYFRCVLDG